MLNERSNLKPMATTFLLVAVVSAAQPLAAQAPTFEAVTGHAFGERITRHHEMARYVQRLGETSDRVRVERPVGRRRIRPSAAERIDRA